VTPPTCPNGHDSVATDYCDTCGAPMGGSPVPERSEAATVVESAAATVVVPAPQVCPNCGTGNTPEALFCEACGYDFTTGAMPRGAAPTSVLDVGAPGPAAARPVPLAPAVPVEWVLEVWVDPDWYAAQDSADPCPSPGLPRVVPLTVRSLLVGRASRSRNIHPEIDCSPDIAVSRRHAQLTTDGTRWWIEDLQSSNGTYVGPASGPLPTRPLEPGVRRELAVGDRVYLGAWTRLVVRRATEGETARP
jgi:hypothetical protein